MVDVIATDDLDVYGRDLDDPVAELVQDVGHILLEDYGSNLDVPTRGCGLVSALSGPVDSDLTRRVEAQMTADDRIDAAQATVTDEGSGAFTLDLKLQTDATALGATFDIDADGNLTVTKVVAQ